jgi:hypothetical protein
VDSVVSAPSEFVDPPKIFIDRRHNKLRSKLSIKIILIGDAGDPVAGNAIVVVFGRPHAVPPMPPGLLGDVAAGAYNNRAGCPGMLTG